MGEARVLCFPVRSARGSFAWITAPLALQRYARDCGKELAAFSVEDDECTAGETVRIGNNDVVLEEYRFKASQLPPRATELLARLLPGDPLIQTLPQRLAIVSDGIFSHFCATACEVQQRIRIDDTTGTVAGGGLFNQENVPSETLFYAVLGERKKNGDLAKVQQKLSGVGAIIQVGGDETIGPGFCSVALI